METIAPPALLSNFTVTSRGTKPSGKGLGLGLAISSSIVQAMNGQLSAQNHPEGGAVMTLTWPEWGEKHE